MSEACLHDCAEQLAPDRSRTSAGSSTRESDRRRLERAADLYLHACYQSQTAARAKEFAEYLRITRPHLSRRAPQLTGLSIRDFLRSRQLAYAKHLLCTTPLSVDQIAVACAFGTPWTFYRCFRAAFGTTPAIYREMTATPD